MERTWKKALFLLFSFGGIALVCLLFLHLNGSLTKKSYRSSESLEDLQKANWTAVKNLKSSRCLELSDQMHQKSTSKSQNHNELTISEYEEFLGEIDKLLNPSGARADHKLAYMCMESVKDKITNSYDFWWRYAKATHILSEATDDPVNKETLTFAAFGYAERALKLNNGSSDAHKYYAITAGAKAEFGGVNERIASGFTFKKHIDIAIALNPRDAELYYYLGRFCYETANISWLERTLASSMFSTPPSSTFPEALDNFEKAERLGKPTKENRLYIGKCYISMRKYKEGVEWLRTASTTYGISYKDDVAQEEIIQLLEDYEDYL